MGIAVIVSSLLTKYREFISSMTKFTNTDNKQDRYVPMLLLGAKSPSPLK